MRSLETLHTPHAMPFEDVTIFIARSMRVAPEVLWQHVRHYDSMPLESDAGYDCPSCNEHNYVAVDPSGGSRQKLIEDCPVCCRPLVFTVTIDRDGDAIVESVERE